MSILSSMFSSFDAFSQMLETDNTKKFNELYIELKQCDMNAQKQKIEEMNEVINKMDKKEFEAVFTNELLNRIDTIIDIKKLTLANALMLMKSIGYCGTLKNMHDCCIDKSWLKQRFQKTIIIEEKKKEEMNESLLIDLCECYLLLSNRFDMKLLSICVQHLMKVASNKEKNEETRKEVEMALLALSCIGKFDKVPKELYLNEIKEIIKYHQEHRNLTQLAYQSAWVFLMERFGNDKNLDGAVADELCFARDAARELEELKECIDWKRKEEEEKEKEVKEVLIIGRWFDVIRKYLFYGKLYNESITGLIGSIIQVFRAAKDNHRKISDWCISFLKEATISRSVRTVDLLESEVVIVFLAEILQATTQKHKILDYLIFLEFICRRLKGKKMDEVEEVKRKELKRKIFDQLEEEGYEDHIVGLLLIFAKKMLGYDDLIKDDETYFVHL